MDPPPPPSHIRAVDVDVIDNNIIQSHHYHRELPHCAVQSEAGITDGQRIVMPSPHCDAQFLEQHPGAQGNGGPCPSSRRYCPLRYCLRCHSHCSICKTSTFCCIVVSCGCARSKGEGVACRFVVVRHRYEFLCLAGSTICGVLPHPLSHD